MSFNVELGWWAALAYSHLLRGVTSVHDAKTPQTRQRRIDKMIAALQDR